MELGVGLTTAAGVDNRLPECFRVKAFLFIPEVKEDSNGKWAAQDEAVSESQNEN